MVACDEYRCDTLRKDAIFESFTEPAPFFWISTEQQSDKVYLLEARHARETILVEWFFDDGTPIGSGSTILYEFPKDSTYTIIAEGITGCDEILRDTIEISITITSTENKNISDGINVFPNPTTSELNIEFKEIIIGEIEFKLNNITGQNLKTIALSNDPSQQIQLSGYASGVYIYQVLVDGVPWKTDRLLMVR